MAQPITQLERLLTRFPDLHDGVCAGLRSQCRYRGANMELERTRFAYTLDVLANEGICGEEQVRDFLLWVLHHTISRSPRTVYAGYLAREEELQRRLKEYHRQIASGEWVPLPAIEGALR